MGTRGVAALSLWCRTWCCVVLSRLLSVSKQEGATSKAVGTNLIFVQPRYTRDMLLLISFHILITRFHHCWLNSNQEDTSRIGGIGWWRFSPCDLETCKWAITSQGKCLCLLGKGHRWCWFMSLDNLPMCFIDSSLTMRSVNQFPYFQHIYKKCLKALSENTDVPVKSLHKQEGWRGRNQYRFYICINMSYYTLSVNG